jgi:hypothetical protein
MCSLKNAAVLSSAITAAFGSTTIWRKWPALLFEAATFASRPQNSG